MCLVEKAQENNFWDTPRKNRFCLIISPMKMLLPLALFSPLSNGKFNAVTLGKQSQNCVHLCLNLLLPF